MLYLQNSVFRQIPDLLSVESVALTQLNIKSSSVFSTFSENLRLFQQELLKLLTCKIMSTFLGHTVYHSSNS